MSDDGPIHLGPWLLEERLARGGMAEVWRGRSHPQSKKQHPGAVCIKRLDPSLVGDPDFVEMFRDEARLVLSLSHDHVVKTFALYDDKPGGAPQELLLIMELIDGPSLARLDKALATSPAQPTLAESLTVLLQLCRALHHVHTCTDDDGTLLAIVHRDVSPQNLLLDRTGRLVLIDFGVARAASRLTLTRKGTLKGKAAYMAPEQVRGDVVDARADQFAAGVVLWELLTRRQLFHGTNELRVLEQIERAEVVPPSVVVDLDPRVQKEVDAIVMRALAFHPHERFKDLQQMAAAIAQVLAALGGPADLAPLVHRGLSAIETSGSRSDTVTRTRVMTPPQASVDEVIAEDVPVRRPSASSGSSSGSGGSSTWPLVMGAAVVVGVVGVAVAAASGGPSVADAGPRSTKGRVEPVALVHVPLGEADELEEKLRAAPSHPCRTELLDELLDRSSLTPELLPPIEKDVDTCVAVATAAPALLAKLEKKNQLVAPPEKKRAKKKKEREKQHQLRLDEMTRRARGALDAGVNGAARALLEEVVSADPARVDERRLLAEAYRRDGAVALAGVELRAYLTARPEDPERPRLLRWLKRNSLPLP